MGAMPYSGLTNMAVVQYAAAGNRLQKPTKCPEELYKLLEKCWDPEPSQRLSFAMIDQFFKDHVKSIEPEETVEIQYADVNSTQIGLQNVSSYIVV